MSFRTKLDYSDNRQIKQRERTSTILSGTTVFGVPFSGLTSGVDYNTTGVTETSSIDLYGTFSGNTTTTTFTWPDARMAALDTYLSALTPSNSAQTQVTEVAFAKNQTTTIDGNHVVLTYSGASFLDFEVSAMTETSSGVYTGVTLVSVDNFVIYSAGTLDYTGRTIWSDCKEISRTKKLIITDNPSAGLVWTCVDGEGLGSWEAVSGITSGMSATTYNDLNSAISSSSLIAGKFYKFTYNTKHLIGGTTTEYNDTSVHYDDGTGVKSTLTAETENLLVLAIAGNKIHTEVYSEQYPNDIIYYDVSNNLTEDSAQPRPGFITYRKDTINDVSAHYDWRNVIHRRYDMASVGAASRLTDWKSMVGFVAGPANHQPAQDRLVPMFSNFNSSGKSDIGGMNTDNEGTYRDFKTFVGIDFNLYEASEPARFLNIHIQESNTQARIVGSGTGSSNTLTNNIYGKIANVVFFTRSAENVTIGRNASGIMIVGKTIKEVVIGDNNENIIIGDQMSRISYGTATQPVPKAWAENISIGNNNRNILIGGLARRITIANNNTGLVCNGPEMVDNTLGSYNTNIYMYSVANSTINDWSTNIRISKSTKVVVGNSSIRVDVVECRARLTNSLVSATFPNGFGYSVTENTFLSSGIYIGTASSNIFVKTISFLSIGDFSTNIALSDIYHAEIGGGAKNIFALQGDNLNIGQKVHGLECKAFHDLLIGDFCTDIKAYNTWYVIEIGKYSSNIMAYLGARDVKIGNFCNNVYISSGSVSIGNKNTNIILRGGATDGNNKVVIGHNNNEVFMESPENIVVGNHNANVTLADTGLIFKPGFGSFATYNYFVDEANWIRAYSGRVFPSQGVFGSDWILKLSTQIQDPTGTNSTTESTVGSNCDEIFIIGSSGCTIGDNTTNVSIGGNATSANFYTLGNTSGSLNTLNTGTTISLAVMEGRYSNDNVIGDNCNNIKIRGVGQSGNTFGNNVSGVEAVTAHTFTNNKIMVDGAPVTTSTSYKGKIYNKSTDIGGRWEESIVNSATTSGLLVSGSEYKITEYIPATSGTTISGKTYEILDIATATSGATISGQTYEIINIATAISGATITGQTYQIIDYNSGDNFINVGASSNATGVVFTATGTAPTNWTNSSKLTADDFINVGASSNATGVVFTATGTTPTNWTNGSKLTADDFTNVGASTNSNGVTFTATGTTPTNWTNGSKVAVDDFTNVGASSNTTGVIFTATGTTPSNWITSSVVTNFEVFTVLPITRLK